MELMGLSGGFSETLEGLLNRQGAWAKGKGVTVEAIEARLAQLTAMIEARRAALARMKHGRAAKPAASVTIAQAGAAAQRGLDGVDDVRSAGTELVRATSAQAELR